MAPKLGSGDLRHRVAFDKRVEVDDGAGNTEGVFQEAMKLRAVFRPRGGSEAVMAGRLEGRNTLGVYVRSSAQTRMIASDWQMRDRSTGEVYAVRIVDSVTDPAWVYIEVQTGVAA